MKNTTQATKSKALGPIPNFSIGLTPSDEEKSDDNKANMRGKKMQKKLDPKNRGKNKEQTAEEETDEGSSDDNNSQKKGKQMANKSDQKNHGKRKQQNVRQVSEEASSDDDNDKKDLDADQRLRHKLSIPKIYDLMQSIEGKREKDKIIKTLNETGFGGMVHICKWTKIHTFFVEWIVKRFERDNMWIRLNKTDVLPLREEDVHRVYELPMAGEQINTKLCSETAIKRLRAELGLADDNSAFVKVTELEKILQRMEKPKAWVKGAICLIIHNILCPTNRNLVSLNYAQVLEDASSFNWCSHILQHMKDGLQNPKVANPLADFHFLMINYMDKMGKRSPFLTGKYKRPSLRDWDVKTANQDLQKVHELMGLENGLTAGVKRLNSTGDVPVVICFDADTCPLSKAEEHLNYCRGCIEVYNTAAKTVQRRIGEANASTSRKLEPTPIDKAHKSEGEETDNSSTEKSPKNLPHLDDAGSRETSKSNEAEQDDNKSSGAEKGVEVPGNKEKQSSNSCEERKMSETGDMGCFNAGQAEGEPSNPNPSTQAENRFNRDDNTKSNDENDSDEEVEIDPNMIDDSVKAACNVGISLTQETIQKFPEFFGPSNAAFNSENPLQATQETTNASESQLSATQETIMKYPEFLNDDSTEKEPEQSLALVLVPDSNVKHGMEPPQCDPNIVIDATPLKSVLPDQIIDLDDITTKKRKKHNMLYSDTSYPERRRAVKKSKYLASPYDDAVHESTASDLQKILSSYAWSPDPDLSEHELLYYSNNKAHKYALERRDLWSLQQDEWVSCFVINAWVNCLNWNQQRDKMTRLVTPMVNYADLAKPGAFDKNNPAAFGRFIERLSKFSYLDWQTIDLNSLEYIMAPALMGDPGSHYVGFVVNLKDNKFEFLNSLKGESLYTKNGAPTMYKHMFDVWLSEVEVFVTEMYRQKNIAMPFKFTSFQWHSPTMPNQIDKCNCGIFCMKFLAEWAGDNTQMDSFKAKLGKLAT
ncbi:1-aminocyclopropane-1-carboxylate synthase [Trifolium repens]|nr:1-aminocyclopropane-1-carboxylate synthase [Trifolium repens]